MRPISVGKIGGGGCLAGKSSLIRISTAFGGGSSRSAVNELPLVTGGPEIIPRISSNALPISPDLNCVCVALNLVFSKIFNQKLRKTDFEHVERAVHSLQKSRNKQLKTHKLCFNLFRHLFRSRQIKKKIHQMLK